MTIFWDFKKFEKNTVSGDVVISCLGLSESTCYDYRPSVSEVNLKFVFLKPVTGFRAYALSHSILML